MNLSAREKSLAAAAAAVVLLSILYAAVLEPSLEKWNHGKVLLAERKEQIAELERGLSGAALVQDRYDRARARVEKEARSPLNTKRLFAYAQTISDRAGARIRGVDPLPPARRDGRDEISIRVDVESELPQLAEFLYLLQTKSKRIQIGRVSIAPLDPAKSTLSAQVQISAAVWRKDEEARP